MARMRQSYKIRAYNDRVLAEYKAYAYEDCESPKRAAIYFMCEDLAYRGVQLTNLVTDSIEAKIRSLTDEQQCAVCELYNEAIRGQWN